jgi:3-oxoacyl-[acyl-carrier-protein] synthase II
VIHRVVVTGLGMVTPVGNDVPRTWDAILHGRSGIDLIRSFDTEGFTTRIGGEIKDFDPTIYMDRKEVRRSDPFVHYAMAAAKQAVADAELDTQAHGDDIAVLIGSGIGGFHTMHEQFRTLFERGASRVSPFFIPMIIPDIAAGMVAMEFAARGPNFAVVSACATSAHSIGEGFEMIRRGDARVVIAGGAEAGITPMAVAAFSRMGALSTRNDEPSAASRPFDKERDGFVIADGAGVMILEDLAFAHARGAHIYGEIVGYGATADAYHITEPAPGGVGLARAMRRALEKAGLRPEDVDYINAHGTSTPLNDRMETIAIKMVFGEEGARRLAISSTKSMIGHTLGAAGAIEAIFSILAIRDNIAPPTINLTCPDPECDLDYVPNEARPMNIAVAMSNSMGFGGHNASLVLRRYQE